MTVIYGRRIFVRLASLITLCVALALGSVGMAAPSK